MMKILPPMIAGIWLLLPLQAYGLEEGLEEGHEKLDQSADWEAFAYMQDGEKVCALSSQPVSMSPRTQEPRAASFIITRRGGSAAPGGSAAQRGGSAAVGGSGSRARNEVAVDAGQALIPDGQVVLRIAETEFMLFSGASRSGAEAQWAWPKNIGEEPKIIAFMKAGSEMEIRAELENGDKIRDLYSLSGVTRGIGVLIENCP